MDLSNRGKALEDGYNHDTLQEFKVIARRNKKIGLWATKLLGIPPGEAEKFINGVISKITHDPDDSLLVNSLMEELKEHFITMSENQIRRQMGFFYQEAKMEIANENR